MNLRTKQAGGFAPELWGRSSGRTRRCSFRTSGIPAQGLQYPLNGSAQPSTLKPEIRAHPVAQRRHARGQDALKDDFQEGRHQEDKHPGLQTTGMRVQDLGLRVRDLEFRVWG